MSAYIIARVDCAGRTRVVLSPDLEMTVQRSSVVSHGGATIRLRNGYKNALMAGRIRTDETAERSVVGRGRHFVWRLFGINGRLVTLVGLINLVGL